MKRLMMAAAVAASTVSMSYGAGFGIYEASARGNAVGGALVADTFQTDATANYYNPALNAFTTNIQTAVGITFINPYCDVDVDHKSQPRMNSGWFSVPVFYLTVPLPYDFAFGWGNYTEYGLGTTYGHHWDLARDTQKTTMRQITLNPNISYKIMDRWSVSAGLRASWIEFYNRKKPFRGDTLHYGPYSVPDAYHLSSRLHGDDWAMGWTAATAFKVTEDITVGLVYRSKIKHDIKDNFDLAGDVNTPLGSMHQREHTTAGAKLDLPQSVVAGVNWKVTEKYRVGASVTWTEWSSVKNINFRIPGRGYTQDLHWNDVWRYGIGMEYDVLDWLTARCGYVYDMDPSAKNHGTTMIPAGDRHIIGTGLGFKLMEDLYLDLGYSFIRMNNDDRYVKVKDPDGVEHRYKFSTRNGSSHLVSATIRYTF